jgi:hypothetical protein
VQFLFVISHFAFSFLFHLENAKEKRKKRKKKRKNRYKIKSLEWVIEEGAGQGLAMQQLLEVSEALGHAGKQYYDN